MTLYLVLKIEQSTFFEVHYTRSPTPLRTETKFYQVINQAPVGVYQSNLK